jgi:ABC-2 type transport system ATP-binding protein
VQFADFFRSLKKLFVNSAGCDVASRFSTALDSDLHTRVAVDAEFRHSGMLFRRELCCFDCLFLRFSDPVTTHRQDSFMSEAVIQIRNLSKIYRDFWGRKKVQALNSLSLDVNKGEIFGLLGPNGSGKTTTMKLLLGLLFPTDGEISILGKPASDVSKNERIGYLPEESYLYRFLNAEETLDFYGRLFDISPAERRERTNALIEQVGLQHARRRQLKEYSKGMTRRIGLAQALINNPDLVLLDEPTSGLDPLGTRDMKDMILKLRDEGKTVVMCSHLLADVQDVCDRIAILFQGELKELGTVDELLTEQDETQLLTSKLNDEAVDEIKAVLAKHNADMRSVTQPKNSLEDLFLKTVRTSQERPGQRFVPTSGDGDTAGDSPEPASAEAESST